LCLNGDPGPLSDKSGMLPGVTDALVFDLAQVERVGEDFIEMTAGEGQIADGPTSLNGIGLCPEVKLGQFLLKGADVFRFQEQIEDCADGPRLTFVEDEGAIPAVIAEWDRAAHPQALLRGGRNLLAAP